MKLALCLIALSLAPAAPALVRSVQAYGVADAAERRRTWSWLACWIIGAGLLAAAVGLLLVEHA
jgi:hypothetical protein